MHADATAAWKHSRPGQDHAVDAVCVAPWVSLELDPSGWVYGCCANQMYPLGRIGPDRLADLWGGPRSRVLRDALSRWDMSIGCGACRWHLEHGRMDPDAAVYDRYQLTDAEPAGPVAMTFALSNRCNLGCVMCTPELSSTLRQQAGLAPIQSPYDDAFFEDLAGFLPGLSYAKFLGGEPFLIPEHHRVWDLMDEVGGPPRMQVTTNGTIWTSRVESVLNSSDVDVTVSIDGATAATYERIRRGASFEDVSRNIDRFAHYAKTRGTELRLCFCLMDNNAHELVPMLEWADRLGAAVSVNVVSDVGLALHDLGADQLQQVHDSWTAAAGGASLGSHRATFDVQLRQLAEVLHERRQGIGPHARQAQPVPPGLLQPPTASGDGAGVREERARLHAWCGGGPVAELHGDGHGTITAALASHDRLGLDHTLVGAGLDAVIERMAKVDGRTPWLVGVDDEQTGTTVRTIVLATQRPVRGEPGAIVRLVAVPTSEGFVLLAAEDRIYDLAGAVAVAPPTVRSAAGGR